MAEPNTKSKSDPSATAVKFKRWVVVLSLVLAGSDFLLGPSIGLPAFFIIPVMLAGWFSGMRLAIALAVLLALSRFFVHWAWQFPLDLMPAVVNNLMRAVTFMAVAYVTARAAKLFRDLRKRVEMLEQQLPVCRCCGVIRIEDGSWVTVEELPRVAPEKRPMCAACEEKRYGSFA